MVLIRCGSSKAPELLENLKAQSLHSVNSLKSFDFSTLYTTIPHDKLKSKLKEIINQCFFHKNGNRRFQYVVTGYKDTYFVRDHSDAPQKYSDADVIKMLEYLIDNIFVEFSGRMFQQTIGIPMGTNCAPLLADLFLYSYEAEFVQSLLQAGKKPCTTIQFHLHIFGIHLSTWTWNKDCSLLLILGLLSTLTMESLLLGFTTNGMTSIFPLLTFHSWAVYPFCTSIRRLRFTVNPLCQSLFKLSGFHGAWESAHYKVIEPGVSKNQTGSNT